MKYSCLSSLMYALCGLVMTCGCGDIKRMRQAAENTSEMNEKMEQMLREVEISNQTTKDMNEKMDGMDQKVGLSNTTTTDMKQKMEDMQSAVDGMQNVTQTMLAHMIQMTTQMTNMSSLMTDMNTLVRGMKTLFELTYKQGRQVGASLSRTMAWNSLVDEDHKIEAKLSHAAIYYYSFEYQSATAEERTDPEFMSYLYYEGVREYLRTIDPYIREADGNLAIDSKDSRRNVLYALSAAMHEYNPLQISADHPPVSMEDLLKHGLLTHQLKANYDEPFSMEIHSWIPSVQYLLALRSNFITGVIIQKISTLDKDATYHFDFNEKFNLLAKITRSWQINYPQVVGSTGLLKEITKFSRVANSVRTFLYCLNKQPVEPSFGLKSILTQLKLDRTFRQTIRLNQPHKQVTDEFILAMNELKQSVLTGGQADQCPSPKQQLATLSISKTPKAQKN